jgi:hypothetical protein
MAAELTQQVPRLNGRPRVNGWSAMWGCSPPDGVWEFCGRGRRRIDRLVTPAGAQATSAFTPPEGRSSASGRRCPATGMPSRRPGRPPERAADLGDPVGGVEVVQAQNIDCSPSRPPPAPTRHPAGHAESAELVSARPPLLLTSKIAKLPTYDEHRSRLADSTKCVVTCKLSVVATVDLRPGGQSVALPPESVPNCESLVLSFRDDMFGLPASAPDVTQLAGDFLGPSIASMWPRK